MEVVHPDGDHGKAGVVWVRRCVVLSVLLAAILWLQWAGGAYRSEFGAHPDEAAHYVTGLMVRDYLTEGIRGNPMRFAEKYYDHYPKVALGHYPPVFYVFEGIWSLLFSGSRTSILLFMAAQSFLLAAIVFFAVERRIGFAQAVMASALCGLCPLAQQFDSMVMADTMLAIFCLLAGLAMVRYLDTGQAMHSVFFGVFASAAILTKGSALFLAAVPALAIVLSRRLDALKRWSFWIPAPLVAILCGPWMILTYRIAGEGWTGDPVSVFFRKAVPYFASSWVHVLGIAILLPAVFGVPRNRIFRLRSGDAKLASFTAVMTAIPLCLTAFFCVLPAGLELRYLLPGVPCVIIMAMIGLTSLGDLWPENRRILAQFALMAACLLGFFAQAFQIPQKVFSGFRGVAEQIEQSQSREPCEILVSSDARGEGALVAELVMQEKKPAWTVRRASKLLAESDWMGRGYTLHYENEAQLAQYLETSPVAWIVVDRSIPADLRVAHHTLLERTMLASPGRFRLEKSFSVQRGGESPNSSVELYHKVTKS